MEDENGQELRFFLQRNSGSYFLGIVGKQSISEKAPPTEPISIYSATNYPNRWLKQADQLPADTKASNPINGTYEIALGGYPVLEGNGYAFEQYVVKLPLKTGDQYVQLHIGRDYEKKVNFEIKPNNTEISSLMQDISEIVEDAPVSAKTGWDIIRSTKINVFYKLHQNENTLFDRLIGGSFFRRSRIDSTFLSLPHIGIEPRARQSLEALAQEYETDLDTIVKSKARDQFFETHSAQSNPEKADERKQQAQLRELLDTSFTDNKMKYLELLAAPNRKEAAQFIKEWLTVHHLSSAWPQENETPSRIQEQRRWAKADSPFLKEVLLEAYDKIIERYAPLRTGEKNKGKSAKESTRETMYVGEASYQSQPDQPSLSVDELLSLDYGSGKPKEKIVDMEGNIISKT